MDVGASFKPMDATTSAGSVENDGRLRVRHGVNNNTSAMFVEVMSNWQPNSSSNSLPTQTSPDVFTSWTRLFNLLVTLTMLTASAFKHINFSETQNAHCVKLAGPRFIINEKVGGSGPVKNMWTPIKLIIIQSSYIYIELKKIVKNALVQVQVSTCMTKSQLVDYIRRGGGAMRVLSRVQWDEYVQKGRYREDSKGDMEVRPIS